MQFIIGSNYSNNFSKLFNYFKENIHKSLEYDYELITLPNTELKLIYVMDKASGKGLFRCIVNMTHDTIPIERHIITDEKAKAEYSKFFNVREFDKNVIEQVYFVQVDKDFLPIAHSDPYEYQTNFYLNEKKPS